MRLVRVTITHTLLLFLALSRVRDSRPTPLRAGGVGAGSDLPRACGVLLLLGAPGGGSPLLFLGLLGVDDAACAASLHNVFVRFAGESASVGAAGAAARRDTAQETSSVKCLAAEHTPRGSAPPVPAAASPSSAPNVALPLDGRSILERQRAREVQMASRPA